MPLRYARVRWNRSPIAQSQRHMGALQAAPIVRPGSHRGTWRGGATEELQQTLLLVLRWLLVSKLCGNREVLWLSSKPSNGNRALKAPGLTIGKGEVGVQENTVLAERSIRKSSGEKKGPSGTKSDHRLAPRYRTVRRAWGTRNDRPAARQIFP